MAKVSTIRNLGPAADVSYARAGISGAEQLRALGADAAYALFLESGGKAHFIGYYALVMGLHGRPWNDCKGAEKDALRQAFDNIVTQFGQENGHSRIEAELDKIGVRVAKN